MIGALSKKKVFDRGFKGRGGEKSTKNREKGKKDPDKEIGFVRFLHYFAVRLLAPIPLSSTDIGWIPFSFHKHFPDENAPILYSMHASALSAANVSLVDIKWLLTSI